MEQVLVRAARVWRKVAGNGTSSIGVTRAVGRMRADAASISSRVTNVPEIVDVDTATSFNTHLPHPPDAPYFVLAFAN